MSRPEEQRGAPAKPHPHLDAMLVCDLAIREEGTGKVSLVGIFGLIWAATFPVEHHRLSVFAMVSDAQGEYAVKLELVRLSDEMTIGRVETRIPVASRLAPAEWIFELGNLVFERAGQYEFRIWADERFVGRKGFAVIQLEQRQPQ